MTLVRWNPTRHRMLPTMFRLMNDFYNDEYEDPSLATWAPAVDIVEDKDEFLVTADLPGLTKKDININIKDNMLTISGERQSEIKDEKKNYCRTERSYGAFKRSFQLTDKVVADKISATFKDGVLTVNIPKAEESKPKSIDIKVS